MRDRLPPLAALRAFEAAARHMSFKAAASELAVTPTAISHQVRALEQACGVALFRRRPRPLQLTEAGAQLFPVLRAAFDSTAAAITALHRTGAQAPLRITGTNAFAHRWLVPRLPAWRALHPANPPEIIGIDDMLDLRAGEADIAIRYARAAPVGLASRLICSDTFWPICRPALLQRPGRYLAPEDLLKRPLIHIQWQKSEPDPPIWRRWVAAAGLAETAQTRRAIAEGLSFREELHAIEAVLAGQGIALVSDVLVAQELAAGILVKAHGLSLPGFGYYVAYVPSHPRLAAIEAFAYWIAQAAAEATQTGPRPARVARVRRRH